jgi:hypothetical protein
MAPVQNKHTVYCEAYAVRPTHTGKKIRGTLSLHRATTCSAYSSSYSWKKKRNAGCWRARRAAKECVLLLQLLLLLLGSICKLLITNLRHGVSDQLKHTHLLRAQQMSASVQVHTGEVSVRP